MIPQERVNEAAETANDYMTPGNHRSFNDGFDCGVRFAEAELQKPELTCPECLSNRILEWPDKYQCRKCEHVWERSVK